MNGLAQARGWSKAGCNSRLWRRASNGCAVRLQIQSASRALLGSGQAQTATQRGSFQFQIGKPGLRSPRLSNRLTLKLLTPLLTLADTYLSLWRLSVLAARRACGASSILTRNSRPTPSGLFKIEASEGFKSGLQFHFGNSPKGLSMPRNRLDSKRTGRKGFRACAGNEKLPLCVQRVDQEWLGKMAPGDILLLDGSESLRPIVEDAFRAVLACPQCGTLALLTSAQYFGSAPVICASKRCCCRFRMEGQNRLIYLPVI